MSTSVITYIKDLMLKEISKSFDMNSISNDLPDNINISALYKRIFSNVINSLISLYLKNTCKGFDEDDLGKYLEIDNYEYVDLSSYVDINSIPSLCESLQIDYLNSEYVINKNGLTKKKSKKNLLEKGAVYTLDEIAYSIVLRTLKSLNVNQPDNLKVLDFATGTGRFYRQIVKCFNELWNVSSDYSVINCVYGIDIDPIAVNICRISAFSLLNEKNTEHLQVIADHIICKNALIQEDLFSQSRNNEFDMLLKEGFDAIVSNPPYLVLKPNKNKMDEETVKNITNMANYFRKSGMYRYSIEGMLNLYQISLEAMVGMLKTGGQLGIICPSTLFADISATKLRVHFLKEHKVFYIKYFSEDDPLFSNVTQATCIFHLQKNASTSYIEIEQHGKVYEINISDVKELMSSNWEIPSIEQVEWNIMKKLAKLQKLKDNKAIRNKRGELDLTLYKDYITKEKTQFRLVRGNMLSDNGIQDVNGEFVLPSFLDKKSEDYKKNDFGRKRLICQQISNQSQKNRLRFLISDKNDILGNSCNYISADDEHIGPMLMMLNSALLNWRFKITSTNNHINNYELDELPVVPFASIQENMYKETGMELDKDICRVFGLEANEIEFILSTRYETI